MLKLCPLLDRLIQRTAEPRCGLADAAGVHAELFPDGRHRTLVVVNIGHAAPQGAWMDGLPRLDHDEVVTAV